MWQWYESKKARSVARMIHVREQRLDFIRLISGDDRREKRGVDATRTVPREQAGPLNTKAGAISIDWLRYRS
jgi:hypothetical protein